MFSKLVENKNNILDCVKAIMLSLIFSIVFVLIFAIFVKSFSLDEKVIVPVNYAIKIISILLGCMIGIKVKEKGIIKGFFIGLIYYFLSILIFSIFSGNFNLIKVNIIDIVSLSLVGIISGIISVNIKSRKN